MDLFRRLYNFIFGIHLPCHKEHSGGRRYHVKRGDRIDCPYCSRSYRFSKAATAIPADHIVYEMNTNNGHGA